MNGSPLDLRPEHLHQVRTILRKLVPRCMVWAFGSRVSGTAKPASDLDLAVACDGALDAKTFGALQESFSQSTLPMKVDIVNWAETSPEFQAVINRGKMLIQKPQEPLTARHGPPPPETPQTADAAGAAGS